MYDIIVITTKKAVISKLPYDMREITVGNFNWTDGSTVWGIASGRAYGQTVSSMNSAVAYCL